MSGHDELRLLLGRVRRRWLGLVLLGTGGRAAAGAAVPLFVAAIAGWLLAPSGMLLVSLVGVALLAALGVTAFVLYGMQRRPDDCRVARFVEERAMAVGLAPELCDADALVSAVQVAGAPDHVSGGFANLIVGKALAVLRRIEPSAIISRDALRRAAAEAAAGTAVLVLALVTAFPYLLRAGATTWIALFPHSIQISVLT
ncbi:MAG: hypothetical protein ACRD15_04895, partial [Vicinamibacterales bacterium]